MFITQFDEALIPIFLVEVLSAKSYPWQLHDQNYDVIFTDDEQEKPVSTEDLQYGNPMGNLWNDGDSEYEYYWTFSSPPRTQNPLSLPSKEKKHGHSTTLCMNVPRNKKYNEEIGYIFKPTASREYNCEAIPPRAINNWEHLHDNATVCKVMGECHTYEREITVFKSKRNSNRNEVNCWHKEKFNVKVGCLCLNHIYQET
ncbi:uncharacterized protein LOC123311429 isoform X2 [Coccinella septempunctata]|uniref:uncharacterized protein LOC123311429 isoform X2 n=1 Tax=Coccinella septempunctata TaxID=41139 RepID=UPI001D0797B6|nr:uncharacterized protein LOC123311429 isoform X2 [Coccinella septempunctata]